MLPQPLDNSARDSAVCKYVAFTVRLRTVLWQRSSNNIERVAQVYLAIQNTFPWPQVSQTKILVPERSQSSDTRQVQQHLPDLHEFGPGSRSPRCG